MKECLILGPEGAGKTLLIRKLEECAKKLRSKTTKETDKIKVEPLKNYASTASEEGHHTVPTVGVNLAQVEAAKGVLCTLRESGGQMAPLWANAYKDCSMLIYVVDSSNQVQVSASVVLFLDILSSEDIHKKPVLLFFNKTDCPLGLGLMEYKCVMRLEDILLHATQEITVADGSCWTGEGIDRIMEWIAKNCLSS